MPLSLAPGWVEEHPGRFEELLAARLAGAPHASGGLAGAAGRMLTVPRRRGPSRPIDQPTWVVHGTLDRVVPVENAAAIKRRIPQASVTELPAPVTSAGLNGRTRSTR